MTDTVIEFLKVLLSPESIATVLIGMVSAIIYFLLQELGNFLRIKLGFAKKPAQKSYKEQLEKLTNKLTQASAEVDGLLYELASVSNEREIAVQKVETRLKELENQESQLNKRIQDLKQVPIPVAEHFATLVQSGEKRSAWRDYGLFGAGIVVSIIIQALIR